MENLIHAGAPCMRNSNYYIARVLGSYHVFAAELSHKSEVVGIIHVAIAHKQQIFLANNLLNASRHLVAKQTFLLAFVDKFRQLLETVLSLSHAVKGNRQCGFNRTETETETVEQMTINTVHLSVDGVDMTTSQLGHNGARNTVPDVTINS